MDAFSVCNSIAGLVVWIDQQFRVLAHSFSELPVNAPFWCVLNWWNWPVVNLIGLTRALGSILLPWIKSPELFRAGWPSWTRTLEALPASWWLHLLWESKNGTLCWPCKRLLGRCCSNSKSWLKIPEWNCSSAFYVRYLIHYFRY